MALVTIDRVVRGLARGLALAVALHGAASAQETSLLEWARDSQARTAHGMYLMGSKVGWMVQESRVEERDGETVLVEESDFYAHMAFEDEVSINEMTETTVWSLLGEGPLVSHVSREAEDGTVTLLAAEPEDGELVITERAGDRISVRQVPMPRRTLADERRLEAWLLSEPAPGETYELFAIDWDEVDIDDIQLVEAIGRREIVWSGLPVEVHDVWMSEDGMRGRAEIAGDGTLLRARIGGIIELRLEPEDVARDLDAAVDMLAAASLPVDTALGDPQLVDELRVVVVGAEDFELPSAPRQVVGRDDDGRLELHLTRGATVDVQVLGDDERRRYLAPTPRIQCDDPGLVSLAAGLVDEDGTPAENARTLAWWVFTELEGAWAANASTALDVLANRAGDCTEHALLFVALARAAGLPAREVVGVMYGDTEPPSFAWHAWAEVHDGRGWLSVDPAWAQLPVDATHVKFGDEQDLSWVALLGGVTFEVLDVRRREADR